MNGEAAKTLGEGPGALARRTWGIWTAQALAVVRLEARRRFLRRGAIPVYLLAFAPVALLVLRLFLPVRLPDLRNPGLTAIVFAGFYQTYFLRFAIFFGCVGIFTQLFRGDVAEKCLHYYFLTPVRREVLAAGKYLSGVAAASLIFGIAIAVEFLLIYAPHSSEYWQEFFLAGPGLSHLAGYLAVTVLACLGYGAAFMLVGLLVRNPVGPTAAILGWESLHFLLPATLKRFSLIHYLLSLCPVALPSGPFAVIAEPTSAWVSVPGLVFVIALVLLAAGWRIRRMEITYAAE